MGAVLGEVRIFAGAKPPTDWAFCDGTVMNVSANQSLFAVIGAAFGGNGTTTFALPDLRGRVPVGAAPPATPPPEQVYAMGETGGTETVTMPQQAVPRHTHDVLASSQPANAASPAGASFGTVVMGSQLYADTTKPAGPPTQMEDRVVGFIGSPVPEPHNNMMPCVAINYIIALKGVFPSQ